MQAGAGSNTAPRIGVKRCHGSRSDVPVKCRLNRLSVRFIVLRQEAHRREAASRGQPPHGSSTSRGTSNPPLHTRFPARFEVPRALFAAAPPRTSLSANSIPPIPLLRKSPCHLAPTSHHVGRTDAARAGLQAYASHASSLGKSSSDHVTGPFTQEVSQSLRLRNPNSDPVAFKVRHLPRRTELLHDPCLTTSRSKPPLRSSLSPCPTSKPCVSLTVVRRYCVRPNSGRIEAGKEVEVQG